METPQTTLEILQAYPLGTLEIEYRNWRNSDGTYPRGRVEALGFTDGKPMVGVRFYDARGECAVDAPHCLPILRPFAALVLPLPDGTVPAKELANMLFDDMVGEGTGQIDVSFDAFNGIVVSESGEKVLHLYSSWLMWVADGLMVGPNEYDYLRRHHFAVDLQPHQFIPLLP